MPRVERDHKQPDVYYFREDDSELEKQDILARLEAIEEHLSKNAAFKVPEPPAGYRRKKVLSKK